MFSNNSSMKVKAISKGNYADVLFFFFSKIYLFFGCTGSSLLLGLSLVAVSRGSSFIAVCGFLIMVISLLVEHGL